MNKKVVIKDFDNNFIDKDENNIEVSAKETFFDIVDQSEKIHIILTKEQEKQFKKDKALLEWLIEKMYVAGGLIELKVCPLNNPTIPKWHNGIETHDSRFNDFIGRINELKRGIK